MKDTLKRMLGLSPDTAKAEDTEKDVTMDALDTGAVTPAADANAVDVAALQASLATAVSELADAQTKIAELSGLVAAATEFAAAKDKAALEAKLSARKAKVTAALGTAKADAFMAATASMEDTAFDAVMSAMATTAATEADTALFKDVGVDAEVDQTKVSAETNGVMDYLTSKYGQK